MGIVQPEGWERSRCSYGGVYSPPQAPATVQHGTKPCRIALSMLAQHTAAHNTAGAAPQKTQPGAHAMPSRPALAVPRKRSPLLSSRPPTVDSITNATVAGREGETGRQMKSGDRKECRLQPPSLIHEIRFS